MPRLHPHPAAHGHLCSCPVCAMLITLSIISDKHVWQAITSPVFVTAALVFPAARKEGRYREPPPTPPGYVGIPITDFPEGHPHPARKPPDYTVALQRSRMLARPADPAAPPAPGSARPAPRPQWHRPGDGDPRPGPCPPPGLAAEEDGTCASPRPCPACPLPLPLQLSIRQRCFPALDVDSLRNALRAPALPAFSWGVMRLISLFRKWLEKYPEIAGGSLVVACACLHFLPNPRLPADMLCLDL